MSRLQVGDHVTANGVRGVVTYIRYAASTTPLEVTVQSGPSPFDLTHPAPADVRLVA
ncbi:hypothetical protein [Arthrobacter bambusae]|uniref:hypothetical protein n=1 Tax=Arthrobacter bambusae TaxID=1338426 RepID=UPI00278952E7|nr:hypothetical protein [Arthrobacter bambusae]MDQ0241213.1 hypothetical protein [Arthrobacter bambusae]